MTAQTVILRGQQKCRQLLSQPKFRKAALTGLYAGAGFFLSGGALALQPQPLALGLLTALSGWRCAAAAVGSIFGYLLFWGQRGLQGVLWAVLGGLTGILLVGRPITRRVPLLIPALSALEIAASGLLFLACGWEDTSLGLYLLRIAAGTGAAAVFARIPERASPVADWLGLGIGVLALAQAAPVPWLNFGCVAAGIVALNAAFPAAALAGIALALSGVTDAPMTEVLCVLYLLRLIPGLPLWALRLAPGAVYLMLLPLEGCHELLPLPGLILGGLVSGLFPQQRRLFIRRGETGGAQVKLELMAEVMTRMQQQLLQVQPSPIDEDALLAKARERACGSCPNRKKCTAAAALPVSLLRKPLFDSTVLPFPCRKPARMILELRRAQERYRNVRADRQRCREYRLATAQQYGQLSRYLRNQADSLPRRGSVKKLRYRPEMGCATAPKAEANGDKLASFYAGDGYYYLLLCDGMGTGLGAAEAARSAASMLQQMLTAGISPADALASLNNLLTLQGLPGAVTVDLAQISLSTGHANLYKWGAPESYLLHNGITEKIGTAGPPPGIGVEDAHMTVQRLSLRRGEVLILVSDGVDREKAFGSDLKRDLPPGELAAKLLRRSGDGTEDDVTAAVLRLHALPLVNIIPPKMQKCCRNTRYGTGKE